MKEKETVRFVLEKQTSLAPNDIAEASTMPEPLERIGPTFRLMFLANEGDLKGIRELLDTGIDVNSTDIDDRTALHVAACQGKVEIVELLFKHGAKADVQDRWGSTMAPMHVQDITEVPEYEIHPEELDFTGSKKITKRGIKVAVKALDEDFMPAEESKLRHPNVVQFLGAVTQRSPMMIVTEYLPKGDLWALLERKGTWKPSVAVKYALDIARNILQDDSGHMMVADFGLSKIDKLTNPVKPGDTLTCQETSCG